MEINEYFSKVYTIAFRLTGEECKASDLAVMAIERTSSDLNKNGDVPSILLKITAKELCRIFLSEPELHCSEAYNQDSLEETSKKITLQGAVLSLKPINRAAIVWKDILGFKIDDLTAAADCSKKRLYCELNSARMQIKSQLIDAV